MQNKHETMTSDVLHNLNCHSYLMQLQPHVTLAILKQIPQFRQLYLLKPTYDSNIAYGDIYSAVIDNLENEVTCVKSGLSSSHISLYDDLIRAIYHNDNNILNTPNNLIDDISVSTTPRNNPHHRIKQQLQDTKTSINQVTPQNSNTLYYILSTTYPNFNPQRVTNLASLKHYSHRKNSSNNEYRFSTQAQRYRGDVRISPLFERWVELIADQSDSNHPISFVYFNNLGLDRSFPDIAGYLERQLTLELHKLEQKPHLKIAVITLPSAFGLMDVHFYKQTNRDRSFDDVYNTFLQIALGKADSSQITDFHLSKEIRSLLFVDFDEQGYFEFLLKQSFKEMGIKPGDDISSSQMQAVWMHFIKFKLTDFILESLQPNAYNFTCKDGIDRGAVSSAYYNLLKSFTTTKPISAIEFDRALHAAATNARGRGMNFHKEVIWNAIDVYVNANYQTLIEDKAKAWLIYWRDMNCPKERVVDLIQIRIAQCTTHLTALDNGNDDIKKAGLNILECVKKQTAQSRKRLLLEIVSQTAKLALNPTTEDISTYQAKAKEIVINYPCLYVIAGLMKIFVAGVLYIPSLGYTNSQLNHGFATLNSGFFSAHKKDLQTNMQNFSSTIQTELIAL